MAKVGKLSSPLDPPLLKVETPYLFFIIVWSLYIMEWVFKKMKKKFHYKMVDT